MRIPKKIVFGHMNTINPKLQLLSLRQRCDDALNIATKKMVFTFTDNKRRVDIEREYIRLMNSRFVRFPLFQLQLSSTILLRVQEEKMRNCWKRICIYCGPPPSYRATDLTPPRPSSRPVAFPLPIRRNAQKKNKHQQRKWIGAIHLLYVALMRRERTMTI
jgi:hypothetical protein